MNLESVIDNSKSYESIQEKRTEGYEDALKALEIVKEFIIAKKRILYGGMSIDISLKLTGHQGIYSDDVVPDYDFYSPEFEKDSYELADILHKKGFRDVNAIGAMHISSRRVRINDTTVVADISYMPDPIYKTIPYLTHKKLRVVDPIFQRMDMHRAISMPLENPPFEVFLHRISKDVKRFKMINEEYEIINTEKDVAAASKLTDIEIPTNIFKNAVVGGVVAYNIMRHLLDIYVAPESIFYSKIEDSGMLVSINDKLSKSVSASFKISNGIIATTIPAGIPRKVTVVTDDPAEFESKGKKIAEYNTYGDDLRPKTLLVDSGNFIMEIFDNLGSKILANNLTSVITSAAKVNKSFTSETLTTSMLQSSHGISMYFLQKYNDYNTPEKEKPVYLTLYKSMLNVMEAAEQVVSAIQINKDDEASMVFYKSMPWFLTAQTYGGKNESPSQIASMIDKRNKMLGIKDAEQLKPRHGYYPDSSSGQLPNFDVKTARFFQFDGAKIDG